jgi:hypothetical protein
MLGACTWSYKHFDPQHTSLIRKKKEGYEYHVLFRLERVVFQKEKISLDGIRNEIFEPLLVFRGFKALAGENPDLSLGDFVLETV